MKQTRLEGLDALRGIAALAVAIHHLAMIYYRSSPIDAGRAVDLFFVISGLVMARTYETRFDSGLSTPAFIARRYQRLFVPMAIGATIGAAVLIMRGNSIGGELAAWAVTLLFLPALWRRDAFGTNVVTWSLFIEILCNALHSAIFARLSSKALFACLVVSVAIFLPWRIIGISVWMASSEGIALLIPRELAFYLIGILVFRAGLPAIPLPGWTSLLFLAAFLLAPPSGYLDAAFLVVAPAVVLASLSLPGRQWMRWAGAASFPIYAVHVPILDFAYGGGMAPIIPVIAIGLLASALIWIERPRAMQPVTAKAQPPAVAPESFAQKRKTPPAA